MSLFVAIAQGVRRSVKGAIERAAARAPRLRKHRGRLILAFHGVRAPGTPARGERTLHLDADVFGRQLEVLRSLADVVALDELLSADDSNGRLVAITFDDAYASALQHGVSQCVARDLPCCVFVSPSLLGLVPRWDQLADSGSWSREAREQFLWHGGASSPPVADEVHGQLDSLRIATKEELSKALSSSDTITLGNHTQHHLNLATLSAERVGQEVQAAQEWLANLAADRVRPYVAYPFGIAPRADARDAVLGVARAGLMAHGGWHQHDTAFDALLIPRWNVPAEVTHDGFRARLLGRLSRAH